MNEPITFYLVSPEIRSYTIKFPNGKILILNRGDSYRTEDKDEQEFLSKQKGIAGRKLDDQEFRKWFTLQYADIPTVYNTKIKDKTDVEEFVWNSDTEEYAVNRLKELGYTVYKKGKVGK